jgi:hypothetical protein
VRDERARSFQSSQKLMEKAMRALPGPKSADGMYVCPRCMMDRSPAGVGRVWTENPTANVEAPYPQR